MQTDLQETSIDKVQNLNVTVLSPFHMLDVESFF